MEYDPSGWEALSNELDKVNGNTGTNGSSMWVSKTILVLIAASLISFIGLPGDNVYSDVEKPSDKSLIMPVEEQREDANKQESDVDQTMEIEKETPEEIYIDPEVHINIELDSSTSAIEPLSADTVAADSSDLYIFW